MLKLFDIDDETSLSVSTVPELDSVEIDGINLPKRKKRNRRLGRPGSNRR